MRACVFLFFAQFKMYLVNASQKNVKSSTSKGRIEQGSMLQGGWFWLTIGSSFTVILAERAFILSGGRGEVRKTICYGPNRKGAREARGWGKFHRRDHALTLPAKAVITINHVFAGETSRGVLAIIDIIAR